MHRVKCVHDYRSDIITIRTNRANLIIIFGHLVDSKKVQILAVSFSSEAEVLLDKEVNYKDKQSNALSDKSYNKEEEAKAVITETLELLNRVDAAKYEEEAGKGQD